MKKGRHTVEEYLKLLIENKLALSFDISDELMHTEVNDLTFNTGNQGFGGIFVCKGMAFREEYLLTAIENGCILYISEKKYEVEHPYIVVNNIRSAMPLLANLYFNGALNSLLSIGVTGTKGKTTTAFMIKGAVDAYMKSLSKVGCAIISSVKNFDGEQFSPSVMTTPEAIEYQRIFSLARDNGAEWMVSEVSSQALKYERVTGAFFSAAIFTNVSRDHISPYEHPDFEDYYRSKLSIFSICERAFICSSDSHFEETLKYAREACRFVYTYGERKNDDFCISNIITDNGYTVFRVNEEEYKISMPGYFNALNALAAISALSVLGIPSEYIKKGIENLSVDGRCERIVSADKKISVIVDYAHNKESIDALLKLARESYPDKQICLIFGCPGKKAYNRRQELGRSAAECDFVILTEDDPADESVISICEEIKKYADKGRAKVEIIEDRPSAIKYAIDTYASDALILVVGKGSEAHQKRKNGIEAYETDAFHVRECINAYNSARIFVNT